MVCRVAGRSYAQMCPVARALDVLGERWTLLVVRELMLGPKRFKDLLDVLPAMGTNRLSDRLRTLQEAGIVARRTLPPPAGARVYELTESGELLRPAIHCLGAWGRQLPPPAGVGIDGARAELIALGLTGVSPIEQPDASDETYEFRIGAEHFHVVVADGIAATRSGAAPGGADLIVQCDLPAFLSLVAGQTEPEAALETDSVEIEGEPEAFLRAFGLLRFPASVRPLRLVAA
jgi:DNA-binding HxlR family transcriptional regulator